MTANPQKLGYSSDVQMHLFVNGRILSIGQLSIDFIMLDDAVDLPPSEAVISLSIDGDERRWTVHLPDGIKAGDVRTRIASSPSASGSSM